MQVIPQLVCRFSHLDGGLGVVSQLQEAWRRTPLHGMVPTEVPQRKALSDSGGGRCKAVGNIAEVRID
jgi:hypothetical protein